MRGGRRRRSREELDLGSHHIVVACLGAWCFSIPVQGGVLDFGDFFDPGCDHRGLHRSRRIINLVLVKVTTPHFAAAVGRVVGWKLAWPLDFYPELARRGIVLQVPAQQYMKKQRTTRPFDILLTLVSNNS